jgi:hypothetical protein
MPPRSAVEKLPDGVKEALNKRLVQGAFSGYVELSEWLKEQGYSIGKSALGEYGKRFEERVKALQLVTEQAKVLVEESPDDDNAVNAALIRLSQEKAYRLLMDMEVDPETVDLPKLIRSIADMGRASVNQKKYAAEVRQQALAEAAKRVGDAAKAQGMDEEQARFWREKVLGAF